MEMERSVVVVLLFFTHWTLSIYLDTLACIMIKALKLALVAFGVAANALKTDYPEPPPILDAPTEWYGSYESSRVGKISSPFTNSDGSEGNHTYVTFC